MGGVNRGSKFLILLHTCTLIKDRCAWVHLLRLRRNLGFLLGLAGLAACTIEYSFSFLTRFGFLNGSTFLLVAAWFMYFLFGLDFRSRNQWLSLGLGLLLLTVPTAYMMGYDSVNRLRNVPLSATRTFSSTNDSVTIEMIDDVYSTFNPFPVTISGMSSYVILTLTARAYATVEPTANGWTILPFQHLRYKSTFSIPSPFADNFRGSVTLLDLWWNTPATASSGFYSHDFSYGFHGYWDWSRNTPCAVGGTPAGVLGPVCPYPGWPNDCCWATLTP